MTSASGSPDTPARLRGPAWAGRNYSLLTAAAIVTSLGANGSLIAAAFAVLDTVTPGTSAWWPPPAPSRWCCSCSSAARWRTVSPATG